MEIGVLFVVVGFRWLKVCVMEFSRLMIHGSARMIKMCKGAWLIVFYGEWFDIWLWRSLP